MGKREARKIVPEFLDVMGELLDRGYITECGSGFIQDDPHTAFIGYEASVEGWLPVDGVHADHDLELVVDANEGLANLFAEVAKRGYKNITAGVNTEVNAAGERCVKLSLRADFAD